MRCDGWGYCGGRSQEEEFGFLRLIFVLNFLKLISNVFNIIFFKQIISSTLKKKTDLIP